MKQSARFNKEFIKLIRYLFTRGTSAFIIIFGRRETGKTDFSLLIAEVLSETEIMRHFATNIKIYESKFPIEHVTNLQDLRHWCETNKGKKLFIFDEYGKALRRRTPMAKLNVKLIDDLQILRKHKLSTLAITPNEKYVDGAALGSDILDGILVKPSYKNQKFALYEDQLEFFSRQITNIPRTQIQFDTWDVAPFKEFGPKQKPRFKDSELNKLWEWSHGSTAKDIGLHPMQLHRLTTKFVKETLEIKASQLTK